MGRLVALKLLAPGYSHSDEFRERLQREACAAGRLHEPHVVPIHQCGEIDGQLYIDMRLIKGTDAQRMLDRDGPLRPAQAVAIVRQVAAALDAAHAAQMIHRDVKPANILLTDDGFAYLVDFGLATAATDARLTGTGSTIGTFAYIAPERLKKGTQVSASADVYSLACVLYECLTGSAPYGTRDVPELVTAHLYAAIPRPSQWQPQLPSDFDGVIARGMAKDPKDRFVGAGELARAAHRALSPADQGEVDTILAGTQSSPEHGTPVVNAGHVKRASVPATDNAATRTSINPRRRSLASATSGTTDTAAKLPTVRTRSNLGDRLAWAFAALALLLVAVLIAVSVGHRPSRQSLPSSPRPQAIDNRQPLASSAAQSPEPTPIAPPPSPPSLVELPFAGLRVPAGVAVDTAGNVYIADNNNNRVLKLASGSHTPVELPFTGVAPVGVAVDIVGNVYVADGYNKLVLKLPAGAYTPVALRFTDVNSPLGVAVGADSNIYITDILGSAHVLKLAPGSKTPVALPFTGEDHPAWVAVDTGGNVYVTDAVNGRVLKLLPGSSTPVELPFSGLNKPQGLAVDASGNVYVADELNDRVLKLSTGSNTPVELPFTDLSKPIGVAVDMAGNVYVTDSDNNRVLELPAG